MVDSTIMCELKDMVENDNKCVICDENINGYGNNAQPVKRGLCCDKCNTDIVIPKRMEALMKIKPEISEEEKKEIQKEKKRVYMREYMKGYYGKKKAENDVEFLEKYREIQRLQSAKRRQSADVREYNKNYNKQYYYNNKKRLELLKLIQNTEV